MSILETNHLGDYEIGYESVSVYLREGCGAEFYQQSPEANCPMICVGMDAYYWREIVGRLLHEAMELTLARQGHRFEPSFDLSDNTARYVFIVDHQQFSKCCADVADFLANAMPDLKREWTCWKKTA